MTHHRFIIIITIKHQQAKEKKECEEEKITATIDGISYKIDSYEHTTEFGNRNKDTVADFLKDSCEGNID